MILLAFLVFFGFFLIYGIWSFVFDKIIYRLPPGPTPVPFFGNLLSMFGRKTKWKVFQDCSNKYGPIYTFYFGKFRSFVLTDSRVIHEALVAQSNTFSWRMEKLLIPGFKSLNPGVIYANHEVWRQRRRFALKGMRDLGMGKASMVAKIHDELVHFLPEFGKHVGQPFNPKILLTNTVSNVICSLVFGKRFEYGDPQFLRLLQVINDLLTKGVVDNALFLAFPPIEYVATPTQLKEYVKLEELTTEMVIKAIEENRRDYDLEQMRGFPDLFIRTEFDDDAMDVESFSLLMTDMFIAGTETTATALGWTLLYLATWPDIQRRCQEAIDAVVDTDRLPTLADRPQLVYLDAVMCEVLRHASVVPGALFHSNLDVPAKLSGYDCPPFTIIYYNLACLHYDASYWDQPDVFNPDRWISPEDGKLLGHSSHFMPFGTGPRICLGELLARVEYFICMVAILQRFQFRLKNKVDFDDSKAGGIVQTPPDYELILTHR